jgi:hypothetical protein
VRRGYGGYRVTSKITITTIAAVSSAARTNVHLRASLARDGGEYDGGEDEAAGGW